MKISVAVFFGGRSVEHEISVISALQAIHAFNTEKYEITPVYITKQGKWLSGQALLEVKNYKNMSRLEQLCEEVYLLPKYGANKLIKKNKPLWGKSYIAKIDIVMPILHGTNGEDGNFQGMIELTGLPYVGCNTLSSANGMDKIIMKMIMKESGIPIVDYVWFTDKQWFTEQNSLIEQIESKLHYPVIIKPANLGSSVGISQAKDRQSLLESIEQAECFSNRIVVERCVVKLKEINCAVLGSTDEPQSSVCEEPIKSGEILSYTDKYMSGNSSSKGSKGMQSTKRRIPADLSIEMTQKIQHLAAETFRVLSCDGVARVDFMIDEADGSVYVNEINTIPGSLSFYLWEESGIKFDQLLDKLIDVALKRSRQAAQKSFSYDQNIFNLSGGSKGSKMGGFKS